jgi:lipopolysaccharide export system permease protein
MMVSERHKVHRLSLIDRYLARQIAVPLIGTLILAAMLLVLDKMLRLFDFVVTAGGPVSVVWRMLANLLPEYFALGIPIGLMLGVLLAFRKLALSSELDALRGIGIGYGRLLRIPYVYTAGLLALNLFIVGWLQPWTHYGYERLRFDLRSGALGASVKVGEFNQLGKRATLRIERSEDRGSRLHGIFIQLSDSKSGMSIAATADHGQFLSTDDPDTILFRLENGRLVQDSPKFSTPRTLSFESYDLPISLPIVDQFRKRGYEELEELTIPELVRNGYLGAMPDRAQSVAARAHFHFRIVEVAMMLMLPLLAVALAVPPKRSTSALGIFISIVMVVAYHKVNQYAEQMGAQDRFVPELALWLPFLGFSGLIVWMYHVLAHKPGGQPIGALERAFTKAAKSVRRLMPQPSQA